MSCEEGPLVQLTQLIELANLSSGRARDIALDVFQDALERADWSQERNLYLPLEAAHDSIQETKEIAAEAYRMIFCEAHNQIKSLRRQIEESVSLEASFKTLECSSDQELASIPVDLRNRLIKLLTS